MESKEYLEQNFTLESGHNGVLEIRDANRVDLAKFLAAIGCGVGVEIGVAHGKYSDILMSNNPELKLYGVDPYIPYEGYKDYQLQRTFNALMADAHTRLDKYPTYEFIRKTSMDALADFADDSLDFVYIDGNHAYPWVDEDIEGWAKKVKSGGIVAGHDYARIRGDEHNPNDRWAVIAAIDKYTEDNGLQLYIWGLNSKADPTLKRDGSRSWMFIKP